jgi:hypothetical protein
MAEEKTLIGAGASGTTPVAGFGSICFLNSHHRNSFPKGFVFDKEGKPVVWHLGDDAIESLTFPFGSLPYPLKLPKDYKSFVGFRFFYNSPADFVKDSINFPSLGFSYPSNDLCELSLLKPFFSTKAT